MPTPSRPNAAPLHGPSIFRDLLAEGQPSNVRMSIRSGMGIRASAPD
ncbi:hypothetical protein [Promineifilum sp.]